MSLGPVVERVLEEYRLAHPEHPILPVTEGDLAGHWDESRLAQLIDNLLQNALRHSLSNTSIGLTGDAELLKIPIGCHLKWHFCNFLRSKNISRSSYR